MTPRENETQNETILTHWSVAQAGSNDEKTGGRKPRWTVPLNNRSKLKGQCTDVKSGCGTSVGPSLNPHSLS